MRVTLLGEHGYEYALKACRRSHNSLDKLDTVGNILGKEDYGLCERLLTRDIKTKAGDPHSVGLRLIDFWFDIEAPLYWWKHMDRYSIGKDQASDSTMHTLTKQPITTDMFVQGTIVNLDMLNWLIDNYHKALTPEQKKFEEQRLFASLPSGFIQGRTLKISFVTLRRILKQREPHKLNEWDEFRTQVLAQVLYPSLLTI